MAEIAKALIPSLPPWVLWTTAGVAAALFIWSKIQPLITEVIPWRRLYARENLRLEVLKLRYEIEALKRQHGLALPDEGERQVTVTQMREPMKVLSPRSRFLWGMLGGVAVPMTQTFYVLATGPPLPEVPVWLALGRLMAAVILGTIGGLVGVMYGRHRPFECLASGAGAVAILQSVAFSLQRLPPS